MKENIGLIMSDSRECRYICRKVASERRYTVSAWSHLSIFQCITTLFFLLYSPFSLLALCLPVSFLRLPQTSQDPLCVPSSNWGLGEMFKIRICSSLLRQKRYRVCLFQ